MLVFPQGLFNANSLRTKILGAAASGGQAISGIEPLGEFSGGGYWVIEFGEVNLWNRERFLTATALEDALDNGATQVIVPLGARRNQPITPKAPALVAFDDASLWDDATSWTPLEVDAVVTTAAALRATELAFAFDAPKPLVGGERFAILHAGGLGWRLYSVIRVTAQGGGSATVKFRPPLRAAVAEGTPLNFESPRCVCHIDGDFGVVLNMLKSGRGGPARFVEDFSPIV